MTYKEDKKPFEEITAEDLLKTIAINSPPGEITKSTGHEADTDDRYKNMADILDKYGGYDCTKEEDWESFLKPLREKYTNCDFRGSPGDCGLVFYEWFKRANCV